MKKIILFSIIIIILAGTAFVYLMLWKSKDETVVSPSSATPASTFYDKDNITKADETTKNDSDISEMKSYLEFINDDNFSENNLTDQSVGL